MFLPFSYMDNPGENKIFELIKSQLLLKQNSLVDYSFWLSET